MSDPSEADKMYVKGFGDSTPTWDDPKSDPLSDIERAIKAMGESYDVEQRARAERISAFFDRIPVGLQHGAFVTIASTVIASGYPLHPDQARLLAADLARYIAGDPTVEAEYRKALDDFRERLVPVASDAP